MLNYVMKYVFCMNKRLYSYESLLLCVLRGKTEKTRGVLELMSGGV